MIRIKELSFAYGNEKVLKSISLDIPDGQPVCIFGASGSGKTTLLRLIAGLERPLSGSVLGVDTAALAFVFQEDRLLPSFSALENLAFVTDRKNAARLLSLVGFDSEDMAKKPSSLSGGMCRRVALLRALAHGGETLILDEPFKGLDSEMKGTLAKLLLSGGFRHIVFTTHEKDEIELLGGVIFEV